MASRDLERLECLDVEELANRGWREKQRLHRQRAATRAEHSQTRIGPTVWGQGVGNSDLIDSGRVGREGNDVLKITEQDDHRIEIKETC